MKQNFMITKKYVTIVILALLLFIPCEMSAQNVQQSYNMTYVGYYNQQGNKVGGHTAFNILLNYMSMMGYQSVSYYYYNSMAGNALTFLGTYKYSSNNGDWTIFVLDMGITRSFLYVYKDFQIARVSGPGDNGCYEEYKR